ncbi:MAG: YbaB/EbfC family nucleoid-associated protein [Acidobacteria bacterium]|nr:MAG: YbaB/EbfC family nucleoid-associated protein [Acidobacteriota bacterium]REJ99629.1 MAG: YbaB/EbfC family nucleoid-associated protein [Acidobacteriota bacterium]
MDLRKMMQQAQALQEKMQAEIQAIEIRSRVGGGLVEVTMNGQKQLTAIRIDPEVLDPSDPEMIQDLVLAAVNDAVRRVDEEVQSKVGSLAPGLGGLKFPGIS